MTEKADEKTETSTKSGSRSKGKRMYMEFVEEQIRRDEEQASEYASPSTLQRFLKLRAKVDADLEELVQREECVPCVW